jgi:hypothetical protein
MTTDTGADVLTGAPTGRDRPPPARPFAAAVGIRAAGRLGRRERRGPAVLRSSDVLGGRQPSDHWVARFGWGSFRDEVAQPARTLPRIIDS